MEVAPLMQAAPSLATHPSAHDDLTVSTHALQQLLMSAGVGLIYARADGIVLQANPRAAELLGRQPHQLTGLHLLELVYPEDAQGLQACLEQLLDGQIARCQRDSRWICPAGRLAHLSLQLTPICDPNPGAGPDAQAVVSGLAVVLDDVGERVAMGELVGAARQAEQASRAKTEFLSRMSHELRTPLNAMLGFAQLLRVDPRHPLQDAQRQKVEHIERAGAHLLAMMSDVLDLSRIEAGCMPVAMQAVPVQRAVEEALALVQNQAAQAQLQLGHHVAEAVVVHPGLSAPPLMVLADPVRLRQVLVNLLSNAIKYNRPGGRVLLEAMPLGGEVMFNVSDTGAGMSTEQVGHLFEPFNRLGAERTAVEGTGIGLVIVHRLTELMRGRIDVSSVPGTGSSFKVWLQQASMAAANQPALGASSGPAPFDSGFGALDTPAASGTERPSPQRKVLYAEDNMINVELVRQVMRMRPHWQLDVALCGQQAIEMARHSPPDLMLLDMHLGDMSGLDVSDALMGHSATAGLPRVALSADAMPDQISEARSRGFLDYLTKPLNVGRFLALLDQLGTPPSRELPPY